MIKAFRPSCGRDFAYIADPSKNEALKCFMCAVCSGPWLDPITHLECGSTFCAQCIAKAENCPTCSQEMTVNQKVPVRAMSMLSVVDSLVVSCPNCNTGISRKQAVSHWNRCPRDCPQGCSEKVTPLSYPVHEEESCLESIIACALCKLEGKRRVISGPEHRDACPADCPFGCGERVAPRDMANHEASICPEANITCARCSQKVKRKLYVSDHQPICPIPCQCGELIAPKDMTLHERSGCKMAPTSCSAAALLCPWIGPRPSLAAHEKECRFLANKDILLPIIEMIKGAGVHLSPNSKGKSFCGQDLSRKVMRGWVFAGADLSGANLEMCDLTLADFTDANMTGCNLIQARMKGTILANANLSGAVLAGANLANADLSKCNLTKANLDNANLSDAIVTGADVNGASLIGVKRATKKSPTTDLSQINTQWPKNRWRQMTNLDLVFSNNNLTLSNTSNNTQSTFAEFGIPLGGMFTWNVKIDSRDCNHCGVGIATPTASIGRGNHGDGTDCWKWQAGGSIYTNGSSSDSGQTFTNGDVLTCVCDRRKTPSIFTIAKNGSEVKRFEIAATAELIPFVGVCCTRAVFTGEFDIPQPMGFELPGAIGLDKAILIDPEAAVQSASTAAAATPGVVVPKATGKFAEDSWRKLSGMNATFSDKDLTLTNTTNTTQTSVSNAGIPLGSVRYWEVKVNNASCDGCGFGVVHANKVESVATTHADSSNCWKWERVGRYYQNGTNISGGERFATGDNIGILCDRRTGKGTLTFYKNGAEIKQLTGLPDNDDLVYPALTPCCTNASFTTNFAAVPPAGIEVPGLTIVKPPPPIPKVDTTLFPKDSWKVLEGLDITFSNNNHTVLNTTKKPQSTTSLHGIPAGATRYWAVLVNASSCTACGIGIALDSAQVGPGSYADKSGCWKWESIGRFFANGTLISQSTGFIEGDILGAFVDRTASHGTVTFFKNGEQVITLQGIPEDPAVLVYPTVIPCCGASFTSLFANRAPQAVAALMAAATSAAVAAGGATTTTTSAPRN